MAYLLLVSLIWSVSFSLFKAHLAGLDPSLMAFLRMALALPLFLPLLKLGRLRGRQVSALLLIGAVQYGVMYAALNSAYSYLQGWQVALMTIFTPLYVSLLDGLWRGRVNRFHMLMALLAVLGAGVIKFQGAALSAALAGFLLVQVANICFALGQLAYREVRRSLGGVSDAQVYALPYLGAVAVTALTTSAAGAWGQLPGLTLAQWGVLAYLGTISSGLCFFLWNVGAAKVNIGSLAAMNNVKVPLAVAVGIVYFDEPADLGRLLVGGGIIVAAVILAERHERRSR